MFGIFGKKKEASDAVALADLASKITATLWQVMRMHPAMLAGPYARVVLDKNWNVEWRQISVNQTSCLGRMTFRLSCCAKTKQR